MKPAERQVLWTTSLSHGLIHVYELAVPALLLLIQRDFGAGDLAMGQTVTLYGLLFGLGSLPAGALVDRVGSKVLLVACLWGSSLSMVGMAFSPTLGTFAVGAACMGLSLSIYHPAGTALLTHSLPLSGRVFATHGMVGNLGVAGSSVLAGSLGALFGWRWAIGLLALIGVAIGARVLGLPAPPVEEVKSRPGRGRWPHFLLLLVAIGFMGTVYRGVTTFLPKFFSIRFEAGTALGGALTTAALLVGLVGMYVAGRAIDRGVASSRAFLVGAVCQAPFLVAMGYVDGAVLLLPVAMSVAFFHFFTQPPGNHMVADFTPPRLRGLGYGIYFFVSFGAGSVGATLGGWISERVDLATTFPVLAAVLAPSVLAVIALVVLTSGRPAARSQ